MLRVVSVWALVAVTAMGSVCAVPCPGVLPGDANGDNAIDILDLQRLVSQVLQGKDQGERLDVNGDGRLDILDFQRLLDRARQADSVPSPNKTDTHRLEAVTPARGADPVAPVQAEPISLITPGKRVTTEALRARSVPRYLRLPKVERYTQKLTPHAPPENVCSAAGW